MILPLLSSLICYKAKVLEKPNQLIREHYKLCTFRWLSLRESGLEHCGASPPVPQSLLTSAVATLQHYRCFLFSKIRQEPLNSDMQITWFYEKKVWYCRLIIKLDTLSHLCTTKNSLPPPRPNTHTHNFKTLLYQAFQRQVAKCFTI